MGPTKTTSRSRQEKTSATGAIPTSRRDRKSLVKKRTIGRAQGRATKQENTTPGRPFRISLLNDSIEIRQKPVLEKVYTLDDLKLIKKKILPVVESYAGYDKDKQHESIDDALNYIYQKLNECIHWQKWILKDHGNKIKLETYWQGEIPHWIAPLYLEYFIEKLPKEMRKITIQVLSYFARQIGILTWEDDLLWSIGYEEAQMQASDEAFYDPERGKEYIEEAKIIDEKYTKGRPRYYYELLCSVNVTTEYLEKRLKYLSNIYTCDYYANLLTWYGKLVNLTKEGKHLADYCLPADENEYEYYLGPHNIFWISWSENDEYGEHINMWLQNEESGASPFLVVQEIKPGVDNTIADRFPEEFYRIWAEDRPDIMPNKYYKPNEEEEEDEEYDDED